MSFQEHETIETIERAWFLINIDIPDVGNDEAGEGLRRVAAECNARTRQLVTAASEIPGVEAVFPTPYFHEAVLRLPVSVAEVVDAMMGEGMLAGVALSNWFPELSDCLLVCATETKTAGDVEGYVRALADQIGNIGRAQ